LTVARCRRRSSRWEWCGGGRARRRRRSCARCLLGLERVGIDDNFFALHSLLATPPLLPDSSERLRARKLQLRRALIGSPARSLGHNANAVNVPQCETQ
jgi:hypothetical protein